MHEGAWSARLGIPGRPAEAESSIVARDLALARLTGGRYHVLHMSTARVGRARARREGRRRARHRRVHAAALRAHRRGVRGLRPGVQDEPAAARAGRRRRARAPRSPTARSTRSPPTTRRTRPRPRTCRSRRRRPGCSASRPRSRSCSRARRARRAHARAGARRAVVAAGRASPASTTDGHGGPIAPGRRREPLRVRSGGARGSSTRTRLASRSRTRRGTAGSSPARSATRSSRGTPTVRDEEPGMTPSGARSERDRTSARPMLSRLAVLRRRRRRSRAMRSGRPPRRRASRPARSCSTPRSSGYQEIVTDPSYAGQIITFTYPHIGNYGVNADDDEARRAVLPGRRSCAISRAGRRTGARPTTSTASSAATGRRDRRHRHPPAHPPPPRRGRDARRVRRSPTATRCSRPRSADGGTDGRDLVGDGHTRRAVHGRARRRAVLRRRVRLRDQALDPRPARRGRLPGRGRARVDDRAADVLAREPDGVFLSNGPGDPAAVVGRDGERAALLGKVPVFGICLGHQIMGLALGAETFKLRFGHHGGNHPVRHLATGPGRDHEPEPQLRGRRRRRCPDGATCHPRQPQRRRRRGRARARRCSAFSVQYHPEAGPGPHDARVPVRRVHRADEDSRRAS